MPPACAALVASLALQAGVTRYTAGAYTAERYFTTVDALAPLKTTALEVGPVVGLDHDAGTFTFSSTYFPRLVMVVDSPPPQLFNQASLSVGLRPGPRLRLTANAKGCYGTNDFRLQLATCSGWAGGGSGASGATGTGGAGTGGTGAGGAGPGGTGTGGASPGVQPIPQLPRFKYLNASGGIGFESRIAARVAASGSASFLVEGGADAPSRLVVPLKRGPSFWAALDWTPEPAEVLTTSLSGSYYTLLFDTTVVAPIVPRADTWIAQVSETWRHALGPQRRLRLGLGVGATGTAVEFPRLVVRNISPVGEVGIDLGFGQPAVQLSLGARVTPFVDFTSGLAYERGDGFATLEWPLHREWRLEASVSAGVALEGAQRGQATGTGRLGATWALSQMAFITAGLGTLWQQAGPGYPASAFREWTFFFGAGFRQAGRL